MFLLVFKFGKNFKLLILFYSSTYTKQKIMQY